MTVIERPLDATLSVTKAARLLGVHANTIRAWSDRGRLRYYRVNPRGDRRYRLADLQRFLVAAEAAPAATGGMAALARAIPGRGSDPQAATGTLVASSVGHVLPEERRSLDLRTMAEVADLTARGAELQATLFEAVRLLRQRYGFRIVAAWERRGPSLVPAASDGAGIRPLVELPATFGLLGRAISSGIAELAGGGDTGRVLGRPDVGAELAAPIPGDGATWGLLHVGGDPDGGLTAEDVELIGAVAGQLSVAVHGSRLRSEVGRQLHQADALRRVAADITSKLDLGQILAGLVDHAMIMFEADRAAVFLRRPDDRILPEVTRGLSAGYLAASRDILSGWPAAAAIEAARPLCATGYADDPRNSALRPAIVQEGFDTLCAAPLLDAGGLLGLLILYHDRPHTWRADDLETLAALATQATVAIRTAQNYAQMATWAAQLQSIQQLGARLDRLSRVHEIGLAIATELRQLIDYHNVRVYRLEGDELVPVAMKGQVGEYVDETVEQLRTKLGEGVTGWVAARGIAQNVPDAAKDPRAMTIPGTEEDLDESMLLAPMLYEDRVLGVLVLSKLGLNQFTDDDLRLLVIYASFAAQAMANADVTERLRSQSAALERQLRSQRDLLQITESILTTLDPRAILDQITERLAGLVRYDNVSIEIWDRSLGRLRQLRARGLQERDAAEHRPGEQGLASWVMEHGEPQLVVDEAKDPRVLPLVTHGRTEGSLIAVPLRGREGVTGVLSLERLGSVDRFSEDEFDLVKLFAAHVSIALHNAEIHRAVEIRAQTDDLTGLLNQGTFHEWLGRRVDAGEEFSLIMLDLDDFKLVNDAAGHQAGDEFLRRIASAIVAAGRDSDSVFRYGGDEFTIILPGTDSQGAAQVADRVRNAVHEVAVRTDGREAAATRVSASIGVATFPADGDSAPAILLAADRACYVAKWTGRDRIALAAEGAALAAESGLQEPTPVDPPTFAGV